MTNVARNYDQVIIAIFISIFVIVVITITPHYPCFTPFSALILWPRRFSPSRPGGEKALISLCGCFAWVVSLAFEICREGARERERERARERERTTGLKALGAIGHFLGISTPVPCRSAESFARPLGGCRHSHPEAFVVQHCETLQRLAYQCQISKLETKVCSRTRHASQKTCATNSTKNSNNLLPRLTILDLVGVLLADSGEGCSGGSNRETPF